MSNSDIDVRAIAEPAPGDVARTDNEALPAVPVIHRARPVNKYTWLYYTLALCIIITSVALVVSGLAIRSEPPYKLQALTPNFLFNFGSCPVYTVESNSVALAEQKKNTFYSAG